MSTGRSGQAPWIGNNCDCKRFRIRQDCERNSDIPHGLGKGNDLAPRPSRLFSRAHELVNKPVLEALTPARPGGSSHVAASASRLSHGPQAAHQCGHSCTPSMWAVSITREGWRSRAPTSSLLAAKFVSVLSVIVWGVDECYRAWRRRKALGA